MFYPPRAAQALGYLNSSRNDIEIFVEDSSAPNLWVKLLRKLLPASTRINNVNILGSRKNVIAACREDQAEDGRKKLYIIDADLDLLKGLPKPNLRHLYRLRAYCVENYLLDNERLIELATSFDPEVSEDNANIRLDLDGWLARNEQGLHSLFVCYAVTHTLLDSEQTVGYSVFRILQDDSLRNDLCPKKTGRRVYQLYKKAVEQHSIEAVRHLRQLVLENSNTIETMRAVSAKDYILPQVYGLMKTYFGVNVSVKQFKVMLAALVSREVDPYLVRRLARICK
ncbi:MAG: DUF4435 domain-containing protein [Aliishimia sp.]